MYGLNRRQLMQLQDNRLSILKHLAEGGTVALRVYGKRTTTVETACTPSSFRVGLKVLGELEHDGFICRGAKTPYKSGHSYPYFLTPQGEQFAA
jgi:hypothetical protein